MFVYVAQLLILIDPVGSAVSSIIFPVTVIALPLLTGRASLILVLSRYITHTIFSQSHAVHPLHVFKFQVLPVAYVSQSLHVDPLQLNFICHIPANVSVAFSARATVSTCVYVSPLFIDIVVSIGGVTSMCIVFSDLSVATFHAASAAYKQIYFQLLSCVVWLKLVAVVAV